MIKFNCSNTVSVILFICFIHKSVIASSFQNQLQNHNVITNFANNLTPKRRSFFETFKNSYTNIIPNKLREISIVNMLTGKRKNKKPTIDDDNELIYSELINNPSMFTSMYSEKFAPQFQSVFSELDAEYAKNPPLNIGSQLALKPISFQPIIDLTPNNHLNNNNQLNNNQNKPSNQIDSINNNLDNNKLNNLLGQQSTRNQFSILLNNNNPLNQKQQQNKLNDANLQSAASISPYTKHFTSNTLTSLGSSISNSLTTNLLNLKNKFSQQKQQSNFFKNQYKSYKDMMISPLSQFGNQQSPNQFNPNNGQLLASANQYNYFQQKPNQFPVFQPQQSFNRYQMIQSPSRKKCRTVSQCPMANKNTIPQQQQQNFNYDSQPNYNSNNYNNKMNDNYESNLINNNIRQKQFYSMMQEKQRPVSYNSNNNNNNYNNQPQQQNNLYRPISDDKGNQIKVGSDIITYDDIEQALRRNNLHKVTNKDAQVYTQLHNLLMNTVKSNNNAEYNQYQVDSTVNVEDNLPKMNTKGKILPDDQYQQSTKGWKPKITPRPVQQEQVKQIKDTDLSDQRLFDEPQVKEDQQKLSDDEDFSQITQQKEQPVAQQFPTKSTTSTWQPVNKPTKKPIGGVKTKSKSKSGTKIPNRKQATKGIKSPAKLAKLQLATDSNNSTDNNNTTDISNSTNETTTTSTTTLTSINDDLSREVEDSNQPKLANLTTTTLITQSGPNGTMKIIKKIKRRKKKRITNDKSNENLLTATRAKSNSKGQAAKLVANSFEDQVKTDISSSEVEVTTSSQLIDSTTTNANTEVQFDDTTATSEELSDQRNKVTSTTVIMPNKEQQVKGRMLAKKRKVLESITTTTTTESSDSLIESSPDTSRDDSFETSLDVDKDSIADNNQDTYFNDNVTESNDNLESDNLRNNRLKVKNTVRKKKTKSELNKPAHTSINSPFADFTATFSNDDQDELNEPFKRKKKPNRHQVNGKNMELDDESLMHHFRIDDVDADDYDNLNNKENNSNNNNENDGFSNGFSNENIDNSETRNELNKLTLNGQSPNQTILNSLMMNNTNIQPTNLVMMSMNSNLDEDAFETDVNETIADLVQKINQANGGDLNIIKDYRNYFTEEEFDLLTDLLKREANKTTNQSNRTSSSINLESLDPISSSKKDQVNTAESQNKDNLYYLTNYNDKFNNTLTPIYLNNNGQSSLKEYYLNNKANDLGKDVLINLALEKKNPIPGQPGIDYPTIVDALKKKSEFSCVNKKAGYYVDQESGCIRYFRCTDNIINNTQQTFYCSDGTLFDEKQKVCSWWYLVDCPGKSTSNNENNLNTFNDLINNNTIINNLNNLTNESKNIHPVYVPNIKNS